MQTTLNKMHHQANDWNRELDFYKDELSILTKRLEEISAKNTANEVMAQVEHFQNKFIMFREQIDILRHEIAKREEKVETISKGKAPHIDERVKMSNDDILTRVKDFSAGIASTRFEFNQFLAKTF